MSIGVFCWNLSVQALPAMSTDIACSDFAQLSAESLTPLNCTFTGTEILLRPNFWQNLSKMSDSTHPRLGSNRDEDEDVEGEVEVQREIAEEHPRLRSNRGEDEEVEGEVEVQREDVAEEHEAPSVAAQPGEQVGADTGRTRAPVARQPVSSTACSGTCPRLVTNTSV
eukprot:4258521-Heterocapsa_arctica.AAC.1